MKVPVLALLLWAVHAGAQAWTLGGLSVRSGVGQPLRAEVELRDLPLEQAQELQVQLASPAQYQAAGLPFPAALANAQVSVVRRSDGRIVARIVTTQAVNEPLVDVLLQARQGGQQQQREYTAVMESPTRLPALADDEGQPVSAATASPARAARAATPAPAGATATVKVKPGDTLGAIALSHKPEGVSLDQMLVALFRANPAAFVDGNMNRLRAGSELTLPSAAQATGDATPQASALVAAHTEDFNRYRQRLAQLPARVGPSGAPTGAAPAQAQVSEGGAEAAGPRDRLVLSQATAQAQQAAAQLAQDSAAREAASRHSELSRNLRELQALQKSLPAQAASAAAAASGAAPAASAASAPSLAAAASASSAAPSASGNSTLASVAALGVGSAAAAGSPVLRAWLDSPVLLPVAGLLLALMVGVVLYRARSWRNSPAAGQDF